MERNYKKHNIQLKKEVSFWLNVLLLRKFRSELIAPKNAVNLASKRSTLKKYPKWNNYIVNMNKYLILFTEFY